MEWTNRRKSLAKIVLWYENICRYFVSRFEHKNLCVCSKVFQSRFLNSGLLAQICPRRFQRGAQTQSLVGWPHILPFAQLHQIGAIFAKSWLMWKAPHAWKLQFMSNYPIKKSGQISKIKMQGILEHRFSPKWSKLVRLTRIPTNVWAPFPSSCLEFIDCRPPGCWSGSHSMPPGGKTRPKTREPDTIPTHCAATSGLILTSPLMFDLLSANG